MKKVVLLTTQDASPGFRLAGLQHVVSQPQSAPETLLQYARDTAYGLVVIDERLARHLPEHTLSYLDKHYPGKVTVLPAPGAKESQFALDIIRQAIGYHVRLKG